MRSTWRGIVLLLGWFCGLCALLACLATAFDAWRDHIHAGWPAAQARVEQCEVREYRSSGRSYYIRCRYAYAVAGQAIKARIDSRMVPDPARVIWRSPGFPDLGDLQQWVDAHPAGAPIELHYDPAAPQNAALVVTDMPLAGPRSSGDLSVVRVFAVLCLVLLVIGRVWRRPQTLQ
jgi:hypothetical protein